MGDIIEFVCLTYGLCLMAAGLRNIIITRGKGPSPIGLIGMLWRGEVKCRL